MLQGWLGLEQGKSGYAKFTILRPADGKGLVNEGGAREDFLLGGPVDGADSTWIAMSVIVPGWARRRSGSGLRVATNSKEEATVAR